MLSRHQQVLASALLALDAVLIFAAWVGAYALRFSGGVPAPFGVPPPERYLWLGGLVTLASIVTFQSLDLYRSARSLRLMTEQTRIVRGVLLTSALVALLSFALRSEISRLVILIFAALACVALCGSRIAIRSALRALRRRGRNLRHVLVIGTGETARALIRKIQSNPDFGLTLRGVVTEGPGRPRASDLAAPRVGEIADLPGLIERLGAQWVYLALERADAASEEEALRRLQDSTASVRIVPDLSRAFMLNASVEDLDGVPVVRVTESPGLGWNALLKRALDLGVSLPGLILLSAPMLAIAAWIRIDSPGPALIRQERVGMNGRHFRMLKFRTMVADAEPTGEPGWTREGDPRRTRAGRFLRRRSLDELPQLANVILGQMSLVGPRPERPQFVERFRASVPRYMLRHHVKAGLTGWAQIHGLRGDTPLDQRIEHDLYYLSHWSLALDVEILAVTLLRWFSDPHAQ